MVHENIKYSLFGNGYISFNCPWVFLMCGQNQMYVLMNISNLLNSHEHIFKDINMSKIWARETVFDTLYLYLCF